MNKKKKILTAVISVCLIFVAIFVVVWIVQYLIWKIRIYKIKEGIQKNN